jgi:hypothetical protein
LANDILIEELIDLLWLWNFGQTKGRTLLKFFNDDLVTEIDTFITDINAWTGDELLNLLLRLATEGALKKVS